MSEDEVVRLELIFFLCWCRSDMILPYSSTRNFSEGMQQGRDVEEFMQGILTVAYKVFPVTRFSICPKRDLIKSTPGR